MKKFNVLFLLLLVEMLSMQLIAQDDMYFVPSKPTSANKASSIHSGEVTYSGSNRDVDEYNRKGKSWSHYQQIGTDDSGNDIIQFQKGRGVYPDSAYIDTTFVGQYYDTMVDEDDYRFTRRMSRYDGFYDPWFYSSYYWRSPFGYNRWGWYSPWSAGWYDPWYYGYSGYYGWYDPWYYGYGYAYPYYGWNYPYVYGYGYPYYGWGGYPSYTYRSGHTGSLDYYDRSNYRNNDGRYSSSNRSRNSSRGTTINNRRSSNGGNVGFGSRRNSSNASPSYGQNNSNFGQTRSYTPAPSRSSNSSFGGGFGGGSSNSGGSRGGGSFGGGRR